VRVVGTVADLPAAAWDALDHGASPFLRYGFLRALEASGSIDPAAPSGASAAPRRRLQRSGWTSVYLLAAVEGRLAGAVPAFIKSHSYGEYIFDWGWANAASRAGLAYYPKLVIAAPATPATGRRILLAPDLGDAAGSIRAALIAASATLGPAAAKCSRSLGERRLAEAIRDALAPSPSTAASDRNLRGMSRSTPDARK
jgi:predicted N-acyltransferase